MDKNLLNKKRLFSVVFGIISLFPFCINMAIVDIEIMERYSGRFNIIFNELRLSLNGNDIQLFLIFACFIYFYYKCLTDSAFNISVPLIILSACYAMIIVIGESFYMTGTWRQIFGSSVAQGIKAILVIAGDMVICYFVLSELIRIIEKKRKREKEWGVCQYSPKGIIVTWLLIFICWIPYILIKYPGILAWDSAAVLKSYFDNGGEINNGVPAFVSLLLIGAIKIGRWLNSDNIGLFLWSLLQSLSLSFIISYFLCFLESIGTLRIYRYLLFALYAFLPLFPFTGMKTGSDTLHTMSMMIYVIYLISYCENRDVSKFKNVVFVLNMFLLGLTRHTGIYILVICMIAGLLFRGHRRRKKRLVTMHAIAILLYVGWSVLILPNVVTNNVLDSGGVILGLSRQQIANTIKEGISAEEEQALSKFFDIDKVIEKYNPELMDPITSIASRNMSFEETKDYIFLWTKLGLKYPREYLQATLNMWYGYFYPDYVCKTKNYMAYKIDNIADSVNVKIGYVNNNGYWRELLDSWWLLLYRCPLIGTMYGCGIYTCILIWGIGYMIMRNKHQYFMAFLPVLLSLGVCMLSPVCGTVRYAFPIIFNIPFLVGVFIKYEED